MGIPDTYSAGDLLDSSADDADRDGIQFDKDTLYLCWHEIGYQYTIALDRLQTHAAVLEWAAHLAGKQWMTLRRLECFIEAACDAAGLSLWNGV